MGPQIPKWWGAISMVVGGTSCYLNEEIGSNCYLVSATSSRDHLWQLWHQLCSLCGLFTTCSHSIFWWYSLCNSVCNFSEPVPGHVSWCMDNCNLYNCFCRVAIGGLMAESGSAFEIFLTACNAENEWYYYYVLRCSEHPESPQTMG